jgi:H2-forming N5,N10-methylenetetrahydromethanopterin dehydrogenase-like enzyme
MTIDVVNLAVILGSLTTIFAFGTTVLRFTRKQIQKQIDDELNKFKAIIEFHNSELEVCAEERELLFDSTYNILEWIIKSHDDCDSCNRIKQHMDEFILRHAHNSKPTQLPSFYE